MFSEAGHIISNEERRFVADKDMGCQGWQPDRQTETLTDPRGWGVGGILIFEKINRLPPSPLGERKVCRQPRTLLDARTYSHTHAYIQRVRMTLLFELTALGWSKPLPPSFFVAFWHWDVSEPGWFSTMADLYNTNLFDFGEKKYSE